MRRGRSSSATYLLGLLLLVSSGPLFGQFYSGSSQEFGKNRVQYQDFVWQYYQWDAIETYFYAGGRDVAEYVAHAAQIHMNELQQDFDFNLSDRIQFIVYNSQTDFRQSNVGITGDEQFNIGGVTRIVGTKVFIYYEGDHAKLNLQVRAGIARVILQQLMYGGNWKDVVKNSTLLNLPGWFTEGAISYTSDQMSANMHSAIKDGVLTGRFDKLNRLNQEESVVAGHAIWNYVAEVYGSAVIPNILYMTRISRNAESGFLYVLGVSLSTLIDDCISFYRNKAEAEDKALSPFSTPALPIKTKKTRTYSEFKIDPYGRYAAYVSNELGQYRVWLHDIDKGKSKKLAKGEHKLARIIDKSFPVLAWHPTGKALSWITEKKGEVYLTTYTLDDKKKSTRQIFTIDKVLDLQYSNDGTRIVMSGVREGQTDIFIFYVLGGRLEQHTNDQYDDLNPRFVRNDNAIIFASNRDDDTLRVRKAPRYNPNSTDIFIYDLENSSSVLERLTNTAGINEIQPAQFDSVRYTYLTDEGNIWNRALAQFDSTISHVDTTIHYRKFSTSSRLTNLRRSILQQDVHHTQSRVGVLTYVDGKYRFIIDRISKEPLTFNAAEQYVVDVDKEISSSGDIVGSSAVKKVLLPDSPPREGERVDIDNYQFIDETKKPVMVDTDVTVVDPLASEFKTNTTAGVSVGELKFPEQRNYNTNFATDKLLTQVDNSYSDQFYQVFNGSGSDLNPGLSADLKLGVSDLFEDYRIVGGFRPALDLNNSDFELSYENLKNRVDHKVTGLIQSNRTFLNAFIVKTNTSQVTWRMKYPFSEVASLRGTVLYRYDRFVQQSVDLTTLAIPNTNDHNAGFKLEYVFDNTINKGLNLYNGWRYKLFAEYYQNPGQGETDMTVVGFDIRHALKVHRDIIWVNRFAGSSSYGSRKVVFFLGGVDNWLFPNFDNSIPIDFTQGYAWQTIGSPLRGFFYNARNGSSFSVYNTELRIPVFKYLLNKPIKSDIVNNFQVVGFGDLGTAWTGSHPYSEDNSFNTLTIPANPLTISLENQREPIVGGYGFGLRTRILGYFVRADWAWGVDDGQRLPAEFYFSLSLDI